MPSFGAVCHLVRIFGLVLILSVFGAFGAVLPAFGSILSDTLFFLISYRFGHFGPGSAETDIAVLSFRLAKRGRTLTKTHLGHMLAPRTNVFEHSRTGTFSYYLRFRSLQGRL